MTAEAIEDLPTRPVSISKLKGLVNGGCIVRKMVGKCGPYLYHVTKHKGKQTWKYLGKANGLVKDGVGKRGRRPHEPVTYDHDKDVLLVNQEGE